MKKIDELKAEIEKAERELKQKKEALEQIEKWGVIEAGEYVNVKLNSVKFIGRYEGISDWKPKIKTFTAYIGEITGLVEKWKPKKGDLCIFWDKNRIYSVTGIFNRDLNGLFETTGGVIWTNCIPFISEKQYKEHIGYEN